MDPLPVDEEHKRAGATEEEGKVLLFCGAVVMTGTVAREEDERMTDSERERERKKDRG